MIPAAHNVTEPVPAAGAVHAQLYIMLLALLVCVTPPEHELQERTAPFVAAKAPARAEPKEAVVPLIGAATKPFAATALAASVTVCSWPGV